MYANHRSEIAEEGLRYFAALYEIEREARERQLSVEGRLQQREQRAKPIAAATEVFAAVNAMALPLAGSYLSDSNVEKPRADAEAAALATRLWAESESIVGAPAMNPLPE